MIIKMTKYCIMTEDLKNIEVGISRNYHFIPVEELASSKTKVNLYNSHNVAKSSFLSSWWGITWDEDKQIFVSRINEGNYVIKKIELTYDIDL